MDGRGDETDASDEILAANERWAAAFRHGALPAEPARRLAVLTCMDARLDPAAFLGLAPGDAHVLRNAGAVATDDALRSLAVAHHVLGVEQALVIGHEGCGMLAVTNEELRARIGPAAEETDFHPLSDLDGSVRASVLRIRESPLLPAGFRAGGLVYDVRTGRLRAVA